MRSDKGNTAASWTSTDDYRSNFDRIFSNNKTAWILTSHRGRHGKYDTAEEALAAQTRLWETHKISTEIATVIHSTQSTQYYVYSGVARILVTSDRVEAVDCAVQCGEWASIVADPPEMVIDRLLVVKEGGCS